MRNLSFLFLFGFIYFVGQVTHAESADSKFDLIVKGESCLGEVFNKNDALRYLKPGITKKIILSENVLVARVRNCTDFAGCADWQRLPPGFMTQKALTHDPKFIPEDRLRIKWEILTQPSNASGFLLRVEQSWDQIKSMDVLEGEPDTMKLGKGWIDSSGFYHTGYYGVKGYRASIQEILPEDVISIVNSYCAWSKFSYSTSLDQSGSGAYSEVEVFLHSEFD